MTTTAFDSVRLMREFRAKLSQEMEPMTARERLRYIQKKAASIDPGRTIAAQDAEATQRANAAASRETLFLE